MKDEQETIFQVFARARDGGFIAAMTGPEAKVWTVMVSRADNKTRKLFPSAATIGRDAGMSERNARRALNRLLDAGMISKQDQSGGRHSNVYRIECPASPTMAQTTMVPCAMVEPPTRAQDGRQPGRSVVPNHGALRPPNPGALRPPNSSSNSSNGTHHQHATAKPDDVDDDPKLNEEEERKDVLRKELAAIGIGGLNLTKIAGLDGLTPIHIRMMPYLAEGKRLRSKEGWICSELLQGVGALTKTLTPYVVTSMINDGQISRIGKQVITGLAGWNSITLKIVTANGEKSFKADNIPIELISLNPLEKVSEAEKLINASDGESTGILREACR